MGQGEIALLGGVGGVIFFAACFFVVRWLLKREHRASGCGRCPTR
jgi:hypothetical protein